MKILLETYAPALIVALLIGIATAYWAFRRHLQARAQMIEARPQSVETVAPPIVQVPEASVPGMGLDMSAAGHIADEISAAARIPAGEGPADDLQVLKGVGAKFAARLNEQGITRYGQLASLTMGDVADLDEKMGPFKGRLLRDRIVDQATLLARGDRQGFESAFGKLGSSAGPA